MGLMTCLDTVFDNFAVFLAIFGSSLTIFRPRKTLKWCNLIEYDSYNLDLTIQQHLDAPGLSMSPISCFDLVFDDFGGIFSNLREFLRVLTAKNDFFSKKKFDSCF